MKKSLSLAEGNVEMAIKSGNEMIKSEKTMTTKELADVLGVTSRTIQLTVTKLESANVLSQLKTKSVRGGQTYEFTEEQATLIKQEIQGHHNLVTRKIDEVKFKHENTITRTVDNEYMTTKQISEQLNTSVKVIIENARKCLPSKIFEHGKTTYWNKNEVTILLDCLKNNQKANSSNSYFQSKSLISTELTPALKIHQAMMLMKEGYEEELALLEAKRKEQELRAELAEQKVIEQQPKVEVYDKIIDSTTCQDMRTVAQTIGIKNIFKKLVDDGIFEVKWTDDGQKYYKPYAKYSEYFVIKDGGYWADKDGNTHVRPKAWVTPKGLIWMTKKYS